MMTTELASDAATATEAPPDDRLAHLVLKSDWPIALCGARVQEHFGSGAPARDRCHACLKICRERRLGTPAWERFMP